MKSEKIYIILLNYNSWKDTIECLESILKSDYENYQIILVDNASTNNSMSKIIEWSRGDIEVEYDSKSKLKKLSYPFEKKPIDFVLYNEKDILENKINVDTDSTVPLILIQSEKNNGFASGNNLGIKYAQNKNDFEYIWLLNNDTVIESDTMNKLINSFKKKNKLNNLAVLGTIQYYYNEPFIVQAAAGGFNKFKGVFWNYTSLDIKKEDIAYIYGASMFIPKKIIEDVGLLNENYFMYYEEIDYINRVKKKGYDYDIDKTIKVYHKHAASTSQIKDDFRIYYLSKNKILIYKKYYKLFCFVPVMAILKDFIKDIVKLKKIRFIYLKAIIHGVFS